MATTNSGIFPATGRKIIDHEPVTRVTKYHHLGLAVTDIAVATKFYEKLGFVSVSLTVMKNSIGMELHFLQADRAALDENNDSNNTPFNVLMDTPQQKYCGHTHACFAVPNVPAARTYLEEEQGIDISGERSMGGIVRSIFVRDPDRTVLEFERNAGDMLPVDKFEAGMIGDARPIDHVGTRVGMPPQRSWNWYAQNLGFVQEVNHYEPNHEDPLKNFIPWISRTETNPPMDINFLINSNMPRDCNILYKDGVLLPGIVYAGLQVDDMEDTTKALKEANVAIYTDDEVDRLGLKKEKIPKYKGPSIFVADPDWNLYRLVQSI